MKRSVGYSRRFASLSAGGVMLITLAGCTAVPLTPFSVPVRGSVVGTSMAYAASSLEHGPRARFINESELPLQVRYWVGRRDITIPGGVADIRTGTDMAFVAQPGDFFLTQLGRSFWTTGMTDAVVRVRIDLPPDELGEPREPIWFQLDQPQPYYFTATGDSPETIAFHRFGGGTISPVPRELWIDSNNGELPVYSRSEGDLGVYAVR